MTSKAHAEFGLRDYDAERGRVDRLIAHLTTTGGEDG